MLIFILKLYNEYVAYVFIIYLKPINILYFERNMRFVKTAFMR